MATYTTDHASHATTERDGEAICLLIAATMTALDWLTNLSLVAPEAYSVGVLVWRSLARHVCWLDEPH